VDERAYGHRVEHVGCEQGQSHSQPDAAPAAWPGAGTIWWHVGGGARTEPGVPGQPPGHETNHTLVQVLAGEYDQAVAIAWPDRLR
jgi:hypothetical protein